MYEVRFPTGVTRAESVQVSGSRIGPTGVLWDIDEISIQYDEVTAEPTELPPTTADLHTELAAYKQFATDIDAAFAKPSPRGLQLDYQHAFDHLRACIKEPME
jgi:hypothetical protein